MRWTRRIAFLAGLGLVALAVAGWRIDSAPGGAPGLDLGMSVNSTGELAVEPAGRIVTASEMRPGTEVSGAFTARNQTAIPLHVRLRAFAAADDLDRALSLRVSVDGETVYAGTLGGLRKWSQGSVLLEPDETSTVDLTASLGAGGDVERAAGRALDVTLELADPEVSGR